MTELRSGGEILIDSLIANGTDTIFGVPGESFLEALDALYDRQDAIRFITCRQEGGAAFMADGWANATGKPGVVFVTRGPGATNASIGLHTAQQGSTPMIMLIGQIPRSQVEREAFQEIDYTRMLGPLTKWVAQINDVERIPEYINRAYSIARNGRPGPVALALPEDILRKNAQVDNLPMAPVITAQTDMANIEAALELLRKAKKPALIIGGTNWNEKGREAIQSFAEKHHIPVATGFRRHDCFDNTHPCYLGNLGFGRFAHLDEYISSSDLIIAIGSRLADVTSNAYSLINSPKPKQKIIHVLNAVEELNKVISAELPVLSDPNNFACALDDIEPIMQPVWKAECEKYAKKYQQSLFLKPQIGPIDMGWVMEYLRENLAPDTIITNGAGNYAGWANKLYNYRQLHTTLAPVSGAMGYGVPAAIAAKIAKPEKDVVCFSGDGDFLMNGQEIATAVQYGANPVILVINNSSLGTIRVHQEARFPGRISATNIMNPDFAAFARSFGANGETVSTTKEFVPAFTRALKSKIVSVIELNVGPENFGPDVAIANPA